MNPPFAPPKKDFLGKSGPPGYIAGIGRGATGFTTRSDIGPARELAAAAAAGEEAGPVRKQARREEEEDEEYLNESNYDEFAGYGGSLFNKDPYEEDDEEADRIYEQIDKHLDERGKALREAKTREELELYRQERPKIQQQFTDLKASLNQVSEAEWMSIPEVGDARNRKQRVARQDKLTPAPDSLLAHQAKIASGGEKLVYLDPKSLDAPMEEDDGEPTASSNQLAVEVASEGRSLNIGDMSDFRSSYMSMKLSRISSSLESNTTANPQDYLTNLQSTIPSQITDASTLKAYRKQFTSLRKSNPTFPNAWIASVRLEEAAGKLKSARSLILAACQTCPKSADIWCEAVRLHPSDMAKALILRAIKEIPRSVKLWVKAADLEIDEESKRRVYEKARKLVPKSVLLWKKSVELEKPEGARNILREAVECCPEAVELWLALARLEPYEDARRTLIKASEMNPNELSIWITAAKLEEAGGNKSLVASIIARASEQLKERGVEIERAEWLAEAADAEQAGFTVTCAEMVACAFSRHVREEERARVWHEEAQRFVANNKSPECARSVYRSMANDVALNKLESTWLSYANFERQFGSDVQREQVLRRALEPEHCAKSESLWLALAELTGAARLDESRQILSDALDAIPDSEKIILAAVELECAQANHKVARRILADACMSAKSATLVMRAARLERELGNLDEATRLLSAAAEEFKDFADFYLTLGQLEEQRGENDKAKVHYERGLKFCPKSVQLWISLARAEERAGSVARARSRLDLARRRNPNVAALWLAAARLELRAAEGKKAGGRAESAAANALLAKGLGECRAAADLELLRRALREPRFLRSEEL